MILTTLSLQNFRNYTKAEFKFSPQTTIIVGPNAIGKSNLIEAIYVLLTGKGNRSDDKICIQFDKQIARVVGKISDAEGETVDLEVVFSEMTNIFRRKYLVNKVAKKKLDFANHIPVVSFSPIDLDIVDGQPGVRRKFLDEAIEAVDRDYRQSLTVYIKALKQRNALIKDVQETGSRNEERFEYWDNLLIKNGQIVSKKRAEFIDYVNKQNKDLLDFVLDYDNSEISIPRLEKYKSAEIGAGVTLVGPHRDDVLIKAKSGNEFRDFGSRGQQRLVALELKLSQIALIKKRLDKDPVLLLDDIFSELDEKNIGRVLDLMNKYQTIATTTHKEFVFKNELMDVEMIELGS